MIGVPPTTNLAWLSHCKKILAEGDIVSPRGQNVHELMNEQFICNMRKPVITIPQRKLNYRFMAAESYWILTGDDRVATIAPYNKNISQFSDDGVKFFGAYGPKIMDQIGYVVSKLLNDRDTRQAGLTIWRENPPKTKDVPCTVTMFFYIRKDKLQVSVFMRSSDAWLGIPYDIFNFSMVAHYVCAVYNGVNNCGLREILKPGDLCITMGSSHFYERNIPDFDVMDDACKSSRYLFGCNDSPVELFTDVNALLESLKAIRESKPADKCRWWETTHNNESTY